MRLSSPWLTTEDAAEYIGCSVSRLRKLTMLRLVPFEKDGSRLMFHRDKLDEFILAGGAVTP
ncbi:MAG TPA: helix-turn-helix domain-containing protein [Solirubrobacteraceae bacterium]|nr:helix-turn-helix domain-containing protein [Solirubrobacteraceae bacterium]